MKRTFALAALLTAISTTAWSGFEEGVAAYKKKDYARAMTEWRPLAESGSLAAQFNIAYMYHKGQGVPQNYGAAIDWYRRAAEQGDAEAQFHLGIMHYRGLGVERDFKAAVAWYTKSANQGYIGAQNNLGSLYSKGEGVPQDYVAAHMWFNLAATNSSGEDRDIAAANREIISQKMSAGQVAEAQRLAREWWANHEKAEKN